MMSFRVSFCSCVFSPFSIAITSLGEERANSSDTEAPFLDLNLCISNGTVSTKIYDKRDDFDFDIVNFPFLDGDVPQRTSYGVYISQFIRFARASSNLNDFNYRNKALTAKLLRQGYRYFKLRKAFSKFYRRHSALLEKYSVSLKTLLQQGISESEFYGLLTVVPVLVLLFVALWFILRGDLLYVFPCVILFLCFSVLLVLRLPHLGKRELILVLFVRLLVCACLDLSVSSSFLGVWEGLRFVIVALPGLFSYLF